jgi:hypothetical protein
MADDEEKRPDPGEILIAEYNYIAQTVFQANEDRARVASFYLVSFGSFIAALFSAQFNVAPASAQLINFGFAGLFLALALMGYLTLLQLVRLRIAWFESVKAMNQVKEYYIAKFQDLKGAFAWRAKTVPHTFKTKSVGFYLALEVVLLGSAALGAAVYFGLLAFFKIDLAWPGIVVGIVSSLLQLYLYRKMLK